jgi:hypothetical protein
MIKEIEQSWNEFLKDLGPDNEAIEKQIKCPLLELFEKQCHLDRARKALFKKEMNQVLKLYLSRIELSELSAKINTHRQNFVRGFGQDRFNHLKLLVRLKIIEEDKKPKKGLLAIGG